MDTSIRLRYKNRINKNKSKSKERQNNVSNNICNILI